MKNAVLILLIIFIINSCSDNDSLEVLHQNGKIKKSCDIKFCNEYDLDGDLIARYEHKDTVPHGVGTVFYKSGGFRVSNYFERYLMGESRLFEDDSTLKAIENYLYGIVRGQHKVFYPNGGLMKSSYLFTIKDKVHYMSEIMYDSTGLEVFNSKSILSYNMPDTVKLGSDLKLKIVYSDPKFDKFLVIYGNGLDETFEVYNSGDVDTLLYENSNIEVPIRYQKIGENTIRGILVEFDSNPNGPPLSDHWYFEKDFVVIP